MPPSQALTETRVPRQVADRAARSMARYAPVEPESPAAPTEAVVPAATTVEPPVDPRANDPSYWQQRFNVTQGMLARERETAKAKESETNRRLNELQEQVRTLQASGTPAAPIDITAFFTPEEIAKYGEEQCQVMARTSMRAAEKTSADRVAAAVQPLKDQQAQAAVAESEARVQSFRDRIQELCPDFDDNDTRWREWLEQIDPRTDATHQSVLNIHIASLNAMGAAKVIKAWQATLAPRPVPPVSPSGTGAISGGGAEPPTPEAVSALTAPTDAEVRDFYKRGALEKVSKEERIAFEARLKLRQKPR
jgi:hypothetical protein